MVEGNVIYYHNEDGWHTPSKSLELRRPSSG